jgi:hypothetical protein
MFELHVKQNGEWKRLKTFDSRRDAMSAEIELERSRKYSGAKVFELVFDPESMANKKKLLNRWSAEDVSRAAHQELDENLDRQRQLRKQIREKQNIENERRGKQIWNFIALSSLSLILVSGIVGMLMLGGG